MEAKQVAISMLALAVLVACGQKQDDAAAMADHDTMPAAAPAPAAGPTDAQIAAIVVTANSGDSAAGMLAKAKSTNPKIRAFGQSMATDHGAVNGLAVSLAQKLNLTPESSPTSEALAQDGQQNLQKLEGLSGSAFDKAYIDHEVALHQQVLDALSSTLIPSAQNSELKALLEKGQPIFQGHLDMAKQVQASLSGS
jgi:putative membrane protein